MSSGPASNSSGPGAISRERELATQVLALMGGTLDPVIDPASLFDAPLEDEVAIRLAAVRIRAVLGELLGPSGKGGRPPASASASASASAPAVASASGSAALALAAPAASAVAAMAGRLQVDPERFADRVALDLARLSFYERSAEERGKILEAHRARQEQAAAEAHRESEHERRVREAEEERQRALKDAQQARSEAERLVSEELARLLGLEKTMVSLGQTFRDEKKALQERRDALLGWQRRAREAKEKDSAAADETYREIRATLQKTRDEMDHALGALSSARSRVPALGDDPLQNLKIDVATEKARAQRRQVEEMSAKLIEQERLLRDEHAAVLLEQLNALNRERLGLLPSLSPQLRSSATGFSEQGWEQARSEARHLSLIVRYHRHVTTEWILKLRNQQEPLGETFGRSLLVLIPWLFLWGVYSWWRRGSGKMLAEIEGRLEDDDREHRRAEPGWLLRLYRYFLAVRRPAELFLLFSAMMWLLPQSAKGLLEVQLVAQSIGWILAGTFVVNSINAIFSTGTLGADGEGQGDELRLRSLRLVGRVVVAFALILVLSARMVGEGTIYKWVLSTCWASAIPLFLVLVRWWREEIFARVERERKKKGIHHWVLERREGWSSILAAAVAAIYLIVNTTLRLARLWLNGFNLARRAHAYLYRRELDKLERERSAALLKPLAPEVLFVLSPDSPSERWIPGDVDGALDQLSKRMSERTGGVVALVGARGMGKSQAMRRLQDGPGDSLLIDGEGCDLEAIQCNLAKQIGIDEGCALEAIGARLDSDEKFSSVLIDSAQSLIRPVMGGLAGFDRVMSVARAHSKKATWVLAIDDIVWKFLSRARGVYPLFDEVIFLEPWNEERIAELLGARAEQAEIDPSFDKLLDEMPPGSDEEDVADALRERKKGYFRLVWDHAGGNPGVALQVWRRSLAQDDDGKIVVRPLQTPKASDLNRLPDSSLFVLRAILQFCPASPEQIEEATKLDTKTIHDALRYGLMHEYLRLDQGKYRVTWSWYQPIEQLLLRRQLLVKR